jgi:lysyl endopeptidase
LKHVIFIVGLMLAVGLNAQLERTGTPVSWNQQLTVPIADESLGEANVESLLAEDATQVEDRSVPYRFAYAQPVAWTMENSGSWFNLQNGDRLWMLGISYEGAQSMAVTFGNLRFPQGGKLYVYSEDRTDYLGPLTDEDNRDTELGLPHVKGQKIFLEYYEPRAYRGEGSLLVNFVSGSYRNWQSEVLPIHACAQWLSNAEGSFQNMRTGASVMRVLVDHGQRYATAVLINNTLNNADPLVIVPTQLLSSGPESMVFQFGLNDLQCLSELSNCELKSICGADVVSVDETTGLALLRMHKTPPSEWDAYYAGWSLNNSEESVRHCIQHPKGLAKSYSRYEGGFMPLIQGSESYIGLGGIGIGQTDGGSVGSPLLDHDHNVVGIFTGGNSRCSMAGGIDRFVLMEDAWMTFRQYLDPLQSSADRIPGMESPQAEVQLENESDLFLYPNPASHVVQIAGNSDLNVLAMEVYDAMGRLHMNLPNTSMLDVSSLNEGVYAVKIITPKGIVSKSLHVTKK